MESIISGKLLTSYVNTAALMALSIGSPVPGVSYGGYSPEIASGGHGDGKKKHRCQRRSPSHRGDRKRHLRAEHIGRLQSDKGLVVARMTNIERGEWNRMGRPDIDWAAAELFSRNRDYSIPSVRTLE